MHDLGGLIWIVIVIIAFISSIRKNVQKAQRAGERMQQRQTAAAAQRPMPRPAPAAAPSPGPSPLSVFVAPEPLAPAVTAPAAPAHDPFHGGSIQRRSSSGLLGGMFESKNSLVRAVVAAEVLGAPKALQEQSIWSPRHSEPSI